MTDLEQRIREAYDAQHASEALRGRTLGQRFSCPGLHRVFQ